MRWWTCIEHDWNSDVKTYFLYAIEILKILFFSLWTELITFGQTNVHISKWLAYFLKKKLWIVDVWKNKWEYKLICCDMKPTHWCLWNVPKKWKTCRPAHSMSKLTMNVNMLLKKCNHIKTRVERTNKQCRRKRQNRSIGSSQMELIFRKGESIPLDCFVLFGLACTKQNFQAAHKTGLRVSVWKFHLKTPKNASVVFFSEA